MVRLLDLPTSVTAIAILLSATALASPLPQRHGGPNANRMNRVPHDTHRRADARTFVYGSGRGRSTGAVCTTYTTLDYTADTFTHTFPSAPTPLSSLTDPDVPRLMTGTDTITMSFGPRVTVSFPSFHTVSASSQNVSTTSFGNSTTLPPTTNATTTSFNMSAIPLATTVSSTSILSRVVTDSTTVPSSSTSSTAAGAVESTSLTASSATPAPSVSICGPSAIPPAPTNEGTVDGCTLWHVAQTGDYCYTVAQQFGINVDTFMAWNPSVSPSTCPRMLAGDAYCVQACRPSSSSAVLSATSTALSGVLTTPTTPLSTAPTLSTTSSTLSTSTPLSSTETTAPTSSSGPEVAYRSYNGDGTAAAGWPTEDQWIDFDTMFAANTPDMLTGCQQWGVPDNTAAEIASMRAQILSVGDATAIDPRFILAIIMQESTGCVRVITTAWSHANPGLMQSFNGTGSCNTNSAPLGLPGVVGDGIVQTPCPEADIRQQILDGTNGTVWGSGLVQDMAEQGVSGDSSRWYRTARLYNGGGIVEGDLALPCCTASYASDVANRLVGWVNGPRTFVQG